MTHAAALSLASVAPELAAAVVFTVAACGCFALVLMRRVE